MSFVRKHNLNVKNAMCFVRTYCSPLIISDQQWMQCDTCNRKYPAVNHANTFFSMVRARNARIPATAVTEIETTRGSITAVKYRGLPNPHLGIRKAKLRRILCTPFATWNMKSDTRNINYTRRAGIAARPTSRIGVDREPCFKLVNLSGRKCNLKRVLQFKRKSIIIFPE